MWYSFKTSHDTEYCDIFRLDSHTVKMSNRTTLTTEGTDQNSKKKNKKRRSRRENKKKKTFASDTISNSSPEKAGQCCYFQSDWHWAVNLHSTEHDSGPVANTGSSVTAAVQNKSAWMSARVNDSMKAWMKQNWTQILSMVKESKESDA